MGGDAVAPCDGFDVQWLGGGEFDDEGVVADRVEGGGQPTKESAAGVLVVLVPGYGAGEAVHGAAGGQDDSGSVEVSQGLVSETDAQEGYIGIATNGFQEDSHVRWSRGVSRPRGEHDAVEWILRRPVGRVVLSRMMSEEVVPGGESVVHDDLDGMDGHGGEVLIEVVGVGIVIIYEKYFQVQLRVRRVESAVGMIADDVVGLKWFMFGIMGSIEMAGRSSPCKRDQTSRSRTDPRLCENVECCHGTRGQERTMPSRSAAYDGRRLTGLIIGLEIVETFMSWSQYRQKDKRLAYSIGLGDSIL